MLVHDDSSVLTFLKNDGWAMFISCSSFMWRQKLNSLRYFEKSGHLVSDSCPSTAIAGPAFHHSGWDISCMVFKDGCLSEQRPVTSWERPMSKVALSSAEISLPQPS